MVSWRKVTLTMLKSGDGYNNYILFVLLSVNTSMKNTCSFFMLVGIIK